MMDKTIRLTEDELKNLIRESVEMVLNEKFENSELTDMVKQHGGLKWILLSNDMRTANTRIDLKKAKVKGYLSPETVSELAMVNWYYPLNEQALHCKDGGAIVIDNSVADWDYVDKIGKRNSEYVENGGEEGLTYGNTNFNRKMDHYAKREKI